MHGFQYFLDHLLIRLALCLNPDLSIMLIERSSFTIEVGKALVGGSNNSPAFHAVCQPPFELLKGEIQPKDPPQIL